MAIKNIIVEILAGSVMALAIAGCVSYGIDSRIDKSDDGYVPWWVEDGVPNSEGVKVEL